MSRNRPSRIVCVNPARCHKQRPHHSAVRIAAVLCNRDKLLSEDIDLLPAVQKVGFLNCVGIIVHHVDFGRLAGQNPTSMPRPQGVARVRHSCLVQQSKSVAIFLCS